VNYTILIAQTQIAKVGLMFMHAKEKQNHVSFAARTRPRIITGTALLRQYFPRRNLLALHVIEALKEYNFSFCFKKHVSIIAIILG
jgi:hypothetical protein